MNCFNNAGKEHLEEEDEFFDFSYYKIERSKTLDTSIISRGGEDAEEPLAAAGSPKFLCEKSLAYNDKINSSSSKDLQQHEKKFASIFAWLDAQEETEDVGCPCCADLEDSHYACADVTRTSRLVTFSPHDRNFDQDVRNSRTASFSHSRSGSNSDQTSTSPPLHPRTWSTSDHLHRSSPVPESTKQRTMSLSMQTRYQSMNQVQQQMSRGQSRLQQQQRQAPQQQRVNISYSPKTSQQQQKDGFYYSTPNCKSDYSSSTYRTATSVQDITRSSSYLQDNSAFISDHRPSPRRSEGGMTNLMNKRQVMSGSTSSFHSRTSSSDADNSCNTEYIYLDFKSSSFSALGGGGAAANEGGYGSSWQVTKKQPVQDSPVRKAYL